jgi:hypothetical protein
MAIKGRVFTKLRYSAKGKTFAAHLAPLHASEWVVYAKKPFGRLEQVLR